MSFFATQHCIAKSSCLLQAIDTPDEDWLDFFAPETDPLDPNGLSTSLREDFLGAVPGENGSH